MKKSTSAQETPGVAVAPTTSNLNDLVTQALEEIKRIDELKALAVKALLEQRDKINEQLRGLGHGREDVFSRPVLRAREAEKVCKVCGQPGHDGRYHRRKDVQAREGAQR